MLLRSVESFFNSSCVDIRCAKHWFIFTALGYLGTPYIWGGDDPSGFDCSGLVIECLRTAGLLSEKEDLTAQGIANRFRSGQIEKPQRAALVCWLTADDAVNHIGICLDESFCIAAAGGSNRTVDITAAGRQNAYIRIRPIRFKRSRMLILDPFGEMSS